jgi:hypothetical protein
MGMRQGTYQTRFFPNNQTMWELCWVAIGLEGSMRNNLFMRELRVFFANNGGSLVCSLKTSKLISTFVCLLGARANGYQQKENEKDETKARTP